MRPISSRFLVFCGVCALLSALTTFGVHLLFEVPPAFAQQVELYQNPRYLFRCAWVIGHCLLVLFSVLGVALKRWERAPGWLLAGLLCFVVFGLTEIFRMTLTLSYVNLLREKYVLATDPTVRLVLQTQLETWSGINTGLFLMFSVAFGLGNLLYGLALWPPGSGPDRLLSVGLLVWAGLGLWGFINRFWPTEAGSWLLEGAAVTWQPLMRVVLGWWLLQGITARGSASAARA